MILINEKIKQQATTIVSALLGLFLFLTLLIGIRQWHADWSLTHQPAESAHISTKNESAEMIAAIPGEHIFGQNLSGSDDAPVTNLQMRVTGIVKVDAENANSVSKAYISISGQPGKVYQVGDSLPYGVKVYDITADTVILENDGHLEKLPLPREKLEFKARDRTEQE